MVNVIDRLSKTLHIDFLYYLKGGFWVSFGQFTELLSALLVSILFARLSSQETFGHYQFLLSLFGLVSIVSLPGLNTSMLRSIAQGYEGTYSKGTKINFLASLAGIPILMLIGLYYYFAKENISIGSALIISSFLFPFYYSPNTWIVYLQAKESFKLYGIFSALYSLISFLSISFAIINNPENIVVIFITSLLIMCIANVIFYYFVLKKITNSDEDEHWIKQGISITLVTFVSSAYNNVDKLLIGIFLSPEQLAVYAVAVLLTNKTKLVFKSLNRVLFPKLAQKDKATIMQIVKKRLTMLIGALTLFTLILYAITPYLIVLLYSQKYVDSIYYARMYLISVPFTFFMTLLSHIFIIIKEENSLIKIQLQSLVLNLVLYFILIPTLGLSGAIISSIVYYILFTILAVLKLKRNV